MFLNSFFNGFTRGLGFGLYCSNPFLFSGFAPFGNPFMFSRMSMCMYPSVFTGCFYPIMPQMPAPPVMTPSFYTNSPKFDFSQCNTSVFDYNNVQFPELRSDKLFSDTKTSVTKDEQKKIEEKAAQTETEQNSESLNESKKHSSNIGASISNAFKKVFKKKGETGDSKDQSKYDNLIQKYADKYGVDPLLVKAVIKQESRFNPDAKSKAGAVGLMQLMPATAKALGVKDRTDPEDNIKGGVKYLRDLLDRFNGNTKLAVAAYNAGPNRSCYAKGEIPNIAETKKYVKKVLGYYNEYKELNMVA